MGIARCQLLEECGHSKEDVDGEMMDTQRETFAKNQTRSPPRRRWRPARCEALKLHEQEVKSIDVIVYRGRVPAAKNDELPAHDGRRVSTHRKIKKSDSGEMRRELPAHALPQRNCISGN